MVTLLGIKQWLVFYFNKFFFILSVVQKEKFTTVEYSLFSWGESKCLIMGFDRLGQLSFVCIHSMTKKGIFFIDYSIPSESVAKEPNKKQIPNVPRIQ
jgi:hypothetical protein